MNKTIILHCSLFSHFDKNKYTPQTVFELAMVCKRKGASMIHVHIDKFESYEKFTQFARMLDGNDAPMLSLGVRDVLEVESSDLNDIKSFGSAAVQGGNATVFGNKIVQTFDKLCEDVLILTSKEIVPEVSIFNFESADNCNLLLEKYGPIFYVGVYMGYPGGMAATIDNVDTVMRILEKVPLVFFTVYNNQDDELTCHIIRMGGHIRTGMEDTLYCGNEEAKNLEEIIDYMSNIIKMEERNIVYYTKKQLFDYMSHEWSE